MEQIPEIINVEKLEEKLRSFLVKILEVPIDRGNIYHTVFSLAPDKRARFLRTGVFTDAEKKYINEHSS